MNGVLVVDKPAGPSSHDVVARVRRATGASRAGHTGTLDPLATGVLPLVLGRATRLAQFMSGADKEYVADVRFGTATDTYDAQGLAGGDPVGVPEDLHAARIRAVLPEFTGTYRQTPPPFSAKKVGGTRAYRLARANRAVPLAPVDVCVHLLELQQYAAGLARLRVVCSAGFYVRTLAHELGRRLGPGAHLEHLRRTRAGDFTLEQAIPLARLEADPAAASSHLLPLEDLLPSLPRVVLTDRHAQRVAHGNALPAADFVGVLPPAAEYVRLVDGSGRLLGIGKPVPGGFLQPVVVLV